MSNVIVKENETLDSALRRFKRNCAKAVSSRRFVKESITKNQA
jgi:S21p: ribosomal protein S21